MQETKKVYGVTLDWHPAHPGKKGQDWAGYGNMTRYVTFPAAADRSDFARELKNAVKRQLEDRDLRNYKVVGSEVLDDAVIVNTMRSAAILSRFFRKGAVA